jgi:predicted Zn-dependent protease
VLFNGFMPAARAADAEDRKAECCRRDNPQIALWQQNADRLYARFKPREAAGELRKVLQIDDENFEALIKLARAYIDRRSHRRKQDRLERAKDQGVFQSRRLRPEGGHGGPQFDLGVFLGGGVIRQHCNGILG